MKRTINNLLSLVFVIISFLCSGQNQEMLVVENAQWFYYHTKPPHIFFDRAYNYKISGDTVLNNKTYKKVLYRSMYAIDSNNYLPVALDPNEISTLCALIREDTIAKKIYVISLIQQLTFVEPWSSCASNTEELLFDYSLNIGDSINMCLFGSFPDTVTSIDSIYLYGKKRRAFHKSGDTYYIEGIGTNSGLFNALGGDLSGNAWWFYEYCLGTDQECGLQYLNVEKPLLEKFKIYPNPASDFITIRGSSENIDFNIYNSTGQFICKGKFENSESIVDLSNLKSGIYFIEFNDGSHMKIIKN